MEHQMEVVSSLQELEDVVTCSIHLGLLKDARLLPCGHSFCRKCIDKCLRSRQPEDGTIFHCPQCRYSCNLGMPETNVLDGRRESVASALPRAIADNKMVELIAKKVELNKQSSGESKQQQYNHNISTSTISSTVIDANVISFHESAVGPRSSSFNHCTRTIDTPFHSTAISQLNSGSASIASSLGCDYDALRSKMSKFKRYKIDQRISAVPPPLLTGLSTAVSCVRSPNAAFSGLHKGNLKVTCADVHYQDNEMFIVMINDYNNTLVVRSSEYPSLETIPITVNSFQFKPVYLKVHRSRLYMSGIVEGPEPAGVLIECRLDGKLIRSSTLYPSSESCELTPVCGFWIDSFTGNIFLALTSQQKIVELSPTLEETGVSYFIMGFHPSYLIRKANSSEIWVSCPHNGRVLVIDEETGQFSQIGTHKIYSAVPSHLIFTSDERIMFLDSSQKRIFWIHKENNYILVQGLCFSDKKINVNISSISAMEDGRILFTFTDRVWLVKPTRSYTTEISSKRNSCHIL